MTGVAVGQTRAARSHPWVVRYGVALLATALAVSARLALDPLLGQGNLAYITLFAAVVFVGWYSGLGPALFSLGGGALAAVYLILPSPADPFAIEDPRVATGLVVYLAAGAICALLGNSVYAARERAERIALEAQSSAHRIGEILGSIADAFVTVDRDWRFRFLNEHAVRRFGRGDLIGKTMWEVFPEAVGNPAYTELQRAMAERTSVEYEVLYEPPQRWFRDRAYPTAGGGLAIYSREITDRKQAEAALREAERRFRLMADGTSVMIWATDDQGNIELVNRAYEEFFGVREVDVRGTNGWQPLLHPEDASAYVGAFLAAARTQSVFRAEARVRRADGEWRWVASHGVPRFSDTGQFLGHVGSSPDITERKDAADRIRASEEFLRRIADVVPTMLYIYDLAADRNVWGNRGIFTTLGHTPEQIVAKGSGVLRELIHPEDWPAYARHRARLESLADGESAELEYRMRHADGSWRWLQSRDMVFSRDEGGRVREIIGAGLDITGRKRAEAALRSAERIEALGLLAGGVAHEANNQMTVVLGCAEYARGLPGLTPSVRQELEQIRRAGERTALITAQLLAFARRQIMRPAPMDLNETIRAMEPILRRTLGEARVLDLDLAPTLDPVLGDPGQIEQVLVNLVLNACDAMPRGGRLTIATAPVVLPDSVPTALSDPLPPGGYARLEVADTGHGIEPADLPRIFEPFFTTKQVGDGTGLGLASVQGIVRQLGGDVRVHSQPGQGATFRIYLPLAASTDEPGGVSGPAHGASSTGTVLVVEDEPLVRQLAARTLTEDGFRVLEAEHGRAALEVLEQHAGEIVAVLSDVAMPVMGGREFAERVARSHPAAPVLLMSGYAADELVRRGLLVDHDVPIVSKPFSPQVLVQQVRAAVAGAAGRGPETAADTA